MTRADPYTPPWGNRKWDKFQGGKCTAGSGRIAFPFDATQVTADTGTGRICPPPSYIVQRGINSSYDPFFDPWFPKLLMVRQASSDGLVASYWNDCDPLAVRMQFGVGYGVFPQPDPNENFYSYLIEFKGTLPVNTPVWVAGSPIFFTSWPVRGLEAIFTSDMRYPTDDPLTAEHNETIEIYPNWRNDLEGAP